jgi:ATP-binding cassette subfamily B protein
MNLPLGQYAQLLATYLLPQRSRVALLAVLMLGGIGLQLANPQVIRYFLDAASLHDAPNALLVAAVLFIVIALVSQAARLATSYVAENIGWTATNALRADLTLHCLRLDMPFHKQHTPGELIERIDGDVNALANFFSRFTLRVLGNGLLVIGILVLLLREDARVSLGLALYVALTLGILGALQRYSVARHAAGRQASAEFFGFVEERISGTEDIRASGAEPYVMNRLYHLMRAWMEKRRAAIVLGVLVTNMTNLLYVIGYGLGLAMGVYLYTQGAATIGTAYLIVFYIGMLNAPVQNIRQDVQDLQQATASIQRVRELLSLRPQVQERAGRASADALSGPLAVELQGVIFAYDDEPTLTADDSGLTGSPRPPASPGGLSRVSWTGRPPTAEDESRWGQEMALCDVSFRLRPGKVLGVLGRTGSGKTTLTRLLFRLYDPASGSIRLNDVNIREVALDELRERVGMVTQDVQLFQATVRDNLTFFNRRIGDVQIERVLKELRLWDWFQTLPTGLDTQLAAGGQGLSAGEAQLLAFTRVFLKSPGLVILDEASSRLDPATETLLECAVDRLLKDRTGIIIAHRLRTVQRADDILILENGRVIEYGPREELARDPRSRFYTLLQTGLEEALA